MTQLLDEESRSVLMKPIPAEPKRKPTKRPAPKHHVQTNEMDELLGYQLRLAYIAISRHFTRAMAHLDLTQKQTGVLWLIGANGGVSQIMLAKELDMDRASMMAIIDKLEDRGLITRERSRHDARRQELFLTPKGRKMLAQSKAALAKHEHWMTSRFSDAEAAELKHLLRRIRK
ncbi:MAG TPA: MarR family transcriptional regulator [Rhizomicrobium sp.]|jgi:DNA-binding MarR family transcriptional regulator